MRALGALAFGCVLLSSADAEARQYKYVGIHPISASVFCHIEAPHVHAIAPFEAVQFRLDAGYYVFVGDPVPLGYRGRRHAYHGHHPIHVDVLFDGSAAVDRCDLDGPHHHHYAPPRRAQFKVRGGVYWYVGKPLPRPRTVRPRVTVEVGHGPRHRVAVGHVLPRPHLDVSIGHRHSVSHGIVVDHGHHDSKKYKKGKKYKKYKTYKKGKYKKGKKHKGGWRR